MPLSLVSLVVAKWTIAQSLAILQLSGTRVEGRTLTEDAIMRSGINQRGAARVMLVFLAGTVCLLSLNSSNADEATPTASGNGAVNEAAKAAPAAPKLPEPKGAKRLSKEYPIWIDPHEKAVIVEGQISLREGMLEMFACTRNTKEHESIVSVNAKAYLVHAGLVALGAEPGHPVRFQPEYLPPAGTEIEVLVRYRDENGKIQTVRAQDWIKDNRTGKPMEYPFVFAGSSFYTDPDTNKKYYQAEHGDFVCVANFGTAMLDIPAKSSKSNEELEFEALTKKIPPLGAPVQLVFKPKLKKQEAGSTEHGAKSKERGAGIKQPTSVAPSPAKKAN
jgi:hypothetical protein